MRSLSEETRNRACFGPITQNLQRLSLRPLLFCKDLVQCLYFWHLTVLQGLFASSLLPAAVMHVVSVPQEDHSAFGVAVAVNSAAVAFYQP